MKQVIVESSEGVTLVAGGPFRRRDLTAALKHAPRLVAADGGADRLLAAGVRPEAVIGDLDSISDGARAALSHVLHPIAEQATTDFDKALRCISAPFVLALGVMGGRIDHELAVLNALVRNRASPCLLIGAQDVLFHAPSHLGLDLQAGDRVSLFPMAAVTGHSDGLRWPIAGLNFRPDGMIGTSNEVTAGRVELRFDAPGMLVMLARNRMDAAIKAFLMRHAILKAPGAGAKSGQ